MRYYLAGAWDGQASDIPPTLALDAQALARLMREGGDAFVAALELERAR